MQWCGWARLFVLNVVQCCGWLFMLLCFVVHKLQLEQAAAGASAPPAVPLGCCPLKHSFEQRIKLPLKPAELPPRRRRPAGRPSSAGRWQSQRRRGSQRCLEALRHRSQPGCLQTRPGAAAGGLSGELQGGQSEQATEGRTRLSYSRRNFCDCCCRLPS